MFTVSKHPKDSDTTAVACSNCGRATFKRPGGLVIPLEQMYRVTVVSHWQIIVCVHCLVDLKQAISDSLNATVPLHAATTDLLDKHAALANGALTFIGVMKERSIDAITEQLMAMHLFTAHNEVIFAKARFDEALRTATGRK